MKRIKLIIYLAGLGSLMLLSGCASQVSVSVRTTAHVNPDENRASLPVLVKVFQLRDQRSFKAASFNSLWMNPQQALGKSLVSMDEVTVMPHSRKSVSFKYNKEAKYVGFIALFRTRHGNSWRAVKPIGSGMMPFGRSYTVLLQGTTLTVE